MIASALFSWQVTHAVRESFETVRYSGSMSFATVALGPKMRILGSRIAPLNFVKFAMRTSFWLSLDAPRRMSMMLTEPSGSTM